MDAFVQKAIQETTIKMIEDTIDHWTDIQHRKLSPYEFYDKEGKTVTREINSRCLAGLTAGYFATIDKASGVDEAIVWANSLLYNIFSMIQQDHPEIKAVLSLKKGKKTSGKSTKLRSKPPTRRKDRPKSSE